ncbi:hypothetical protein M0802_002027 [Mischocyttarus mexicanus]|nr:hypothetical protein M0802_002027 [Mischocyttarus mexicanus]
MEEQNRCPRELNATRFAEEKSSPNRNENGDVSKLACHTQPPPPSSPPPSPSLPPSAAAAAALPTHTASPSPPMQSHCALLIPVYCHSKQ